MTTDTTDPLAAAIDHIRRITPSNVPWTAKDFADDPQGSAEVDASIAIILNAVVAGQLISLATPLDEIERLETRIRSLDHALNFILSDAAWTPKHPACESIINRINALRKGSGQ